MKHTFLVPKKIFFALKSSTIKKKECRVGTKNRVSRVNKKQTTFFMPYRLAVIKLHSHAPAVVGSAHQLDFVNVFN